MKPFIYTNVKGNIDDLDYEVVETKGKGHPDNICDTLAEQISINYYGLLYDIYSICLIFRLNIFFLLFFGCLILYLFDLILLLQNRHDIIFYNYL